MTDKTKEPKLNPLPGERRPNLTEKTQIPALEQIEKKSEQELATEETEKPEPDTQRPAETSLLKRRPKIAIPQVRDEVTVKIEKILEEGVGDAYARLSPIAKQEFKIKGEETATKIRELLKSTHVKVKKIFQLILEWLKMLPGVNRFFLEQEAKIKADRIITLHKK